MTVVSVLLGTLWAGGGGISWGLGVLAVVTGVALHAGANLANDYFDVKERVDRPNSRRVRQRPHPLALGWIAPRQVKLAAAICFGIGLGCGTYLSVQSGWPILLFGLVGAVLGLLYTGGPFPLKRYAVGELVVLFTWGPLATGAAYYVQARRLSGPLVMVSLPVGGLVALVLLANNLRDAASDEENLVRTLPLVAGPATARFLFCCLMFAAVAGTVAMSVFGPLDLGSLITLLALPMGYPLCRMIRGTIPLDADARTARFVVSYGTLLCAAVACQKLLQWP